MLRAKLRFRWVSVSGDNGKCLKWLARWLHLEESPPRAPHLAADRNPPPTENRGAVCSDPGCAVILQGVINSLVIKRKPKYLGFPCSLEHPAVPFRRCVWVLGSPSAGRGCFLGLVQNQGSLCWTPAPAGGAHLLALCSHSCFSGSQQQHCAAWRGEIGLQNSLQNHRSRDVSKPASRKSPQSFARAAVPIPCARG